MGNRPKPTILKLIQGNPGKRPLNESEPEPPKGIPEMPAYLEAFPIAVSEWEREVKILDDMGIMTIADSGILATRCYMAAQIQAISKEIKKKGRTIKTMMGRKTNPLVTQLTKYITEYRQIGNLLGLDPSGRSKIKVSRKPQKSAFEKFMDRKKNGTAN